MVDVVLSYVIVIVNHPEERWRILLSSKDKEKQIVCELKEWFEHNKVTCCFDLVSL